MAGLDDFQNVPGHKHACLFYGAMLKLREGESSFIRCYQPPTTDSVANYQKLVHRK